MINKGFLVSNMKLIWKEIKTRHKNYLQRNAITFRYCTYEVFSFYFFFSHLQFSSKLVSFSARGLENARKWKFHDRLTSPCAERPKGWHHLTAGWHHLTTLLPQRREQCHPGSNVPHPLTAPNPADFSPCKLSFCKFCRPGTLANSVSRQRDAFCLSSFFFAFNKEKDETIKTGLILDNVTEAIILLRAIHTRI